jgi:predicted DNA-binding transcriptional regulator YafY
MSIIKYLNRITRIHNLIKRRSTGCACKFSEKLDLSKSSLMKNIAEMKELGFPIEFDRLRNTYYYDSEKINYEKIEEISPEVLKKIFGGHQNLAFFKFNSCCYEDIE